MHFWLKQSLIIILVISVGVYLITLQQSQSTSSPISNKQKTPSEGLTDFYAEMKEKFDTTPQVKDSYILELRHAKSIDIKTQLDHLTTITKPLNNKWRGSVTNNEFEAGTTLMHELSKIAARENINLVWWLDRDFVVKYPFFVNSTAVETLYQVAKAIDSDFETKVKGYFCPEQRALVITDKPSEHLRKNCVTDR